MFLFKFVLFHHIIVGRTNIYFCEQLNFNIFMHTFLYFNTVILTWYDFTSYSIVLLMNKLCSGLLHFEHLF